MRVIVKRLPYRHVSSVFLCPPHPPRNPPGRTPLSQVIKKGSYVRSKKKALYIQNFTNYPIVIGRFLTRNRKKITIFLTSKLTNKTLFEIKSSLRQRHDIFSDCVKIIVLSWPFFVGNLKKKLHKKTLGKREKYTEKNP